MVLVTPGTFGLKRPYNTRQLARDIFRKVDCLACGKCCNSASRLAVAQWDPNISAIRAEVKARNLKTTDRENNGFDVLSSNGSVCNFLSGTSCGIYEKRPYLCRTYPFVPRELHVDTRHMALEADERIVFVLTSECPPVAELKKAEIGYLSVTDIATKIGHGADVRFEDTLPLLWPSLDALTRLVNARIFQSSMFCKFPGTREVWFPLW